MRHEVIWGASDAVAAWVSGMIGNPSFGPNMSAGILVDGKAAAGCVFHNYLKSPEGLPISMEVSCAAVDRRWASRQVLRELFIYPFITVGVKRLQVSIPVASKGVIRFNEKLGFTWEGTGRHAHFLGGDLYVMSMLKPECQWIREYDHGKIHASGVTASAIANGAGILPG